MPIQWPPTPDPGDTYTYGPTTWVWNGVAWQQQANEGQAVSVWVPIDYV